MLNGARIHVGERINMTLSLSCRELPASPQLQKQYVQKIARSVQQSQQFHLAVICKVVICKVELL